MSFIDPVLESVDSLLAWFSFSIKQSISAYCELETGDSRTCLATKHGSLASVIRIKGVTSLIGQPEFERLYKGLAQSLRSALSRSGHSVQVHFNYDNEYIEQQIQEIFRPATLTAKNLALDLEDLFEERARYIGRYCATESLFLVLYTNPTTLSREQLKRANKAKQKSLKENKTVFKQSQNLMAPMPELRDTHESFVRATLDDLRDLNLYCDLLDIHAAVKEMRKIADPDFTSRDWRAILPGDKLPVRIAKRFSGEPADLLWPPLSKQILPRDGEVLDLRSVRLGDRIYASVFIDLFPQDIKPFNNLLQRVIAAQVPWRMSYLIDGDGLKTMGLKPVLSAILSFSSQQNRLINDSSNLLKYIDINTDDAVVKLRVCFSTWAPVDEMQLLRTRAAQLSKAVQGWGTCEVSEVCGDAFAGMVSSLLGLTQNSMATASIAPLSDVAYMLPITRPASAWEQGAVLFRSPDGKPWPYQPGSSAQTTWIDLLYARPGSGKSVLSNAINLALCLSGGIKRLPRIAIIDIGPSSSGLISLLKEALPMDKRHLVAYHRLRMTPEYAINPFDTQLGCRFPTPQERSFLVNFLTLLSTPVGSSKPYDGIADMAGLIVDELYKNLNDDGNPYTYTNGVDALIDGVLEEINFVADRHTTWWEVTDALFNAGFTHYAALSQRFAMPLLADAASICRTQAVEDLYGHIVAPTGEPLITAFARMISSAVREYPILSRVTSFDIGNARVVSLDLDEVAKSGGDAAERQTAVMYMLARYVLARHYYLTEDNVEDMPENYRIFHGKRIAEIREDPKRIVYDEFHRTSKVQAVRDQVIIDMREGRKWKVQVGLISQSLDDFDSIMVEFATSIFIMDAGPEVAVKKTTEIFGLSETAANGLRYNVHGPREGGATFLAQFATKRGMNTQLLTSTLGPIELWAFSTTADDSKIRNELYKRLGPKEARRTLSKLFPSGSIAKVVEERLQRIKETDVLVTEEAKLSVVDELLGEILEIHSKWVAE